MHARLRPFFVDEEHQLVEDLSGTLQAWHCLVRQGVSDD
jgi:hypothetical protein